MKPVFITRNDQALDSLDVKYLESPHSSNQYHYHDEFEILYNIEDSGVRCIGDSIERYQNNDLVFLGYKIPHFWHSDEEYFIADSGFTTKAVRIKFNSVIIDNLMLLPEMTGLQDLLNRSGRGINFTGFTAGVIGEKMICLSQMKGWRRLLLLIEILYLMSESKNFRLLSSTSISENPLKNSEEKISKIFNLMVEKHNLDLTLEDVASHVNMSVSAFCRYFKKHTTKTYSQLLNEIRIGFACKSLIYTDQTISEIAFSSGYRNVPYFNRLFKRLKETTPNEYRQKHMNMTVN